EGSTSVPSGAAGRARRTVLASDPGTDRIALGVVTDNHDSWAKVWSGSAWGDAQVLSTTTGTSTGLAVAVAFEAVSGDLVAAYADDDNRVRYRTWTSAGGWTAEADVSDFGAKARSVVLFPDDDTDEMMVGAVDVNSGLNMSRWDGSTWWTDEILLEKDTAESENQPFIFLWDVVGLAPQPASSAIPLPVVGHTAAAWSDATDLGLADEFSCATTTSGKAYCWGRNEHGELGDGTMTQRTVPTRVVGSGGSATLDDVSVVGGGWNTHTCASVADREELWCWGRNNKGQLGDGTTTDSSSPVFSRGST
ncbi:MAG: RCC1 domain-containing protein, partial [Acidimicrobiia bacterium]|nr:RCC1 domain-containing protein [Acidimicrobiia bacterium]